MGRGRQEGAPGGPRPWPAASLGSAAGSPPTLDRQPVPPACQPDKQESLEALSAQAVSAPPAPAPAPAPSLVSARLPSPPGHSSFSPRLLDLEVCVHIPQGLSPPAPSPFSGLCPSPPPAPSKREGPGSELPHSSLSGVKRASGPMWDPCPHPELPAVQPRALRSSLLRHLPQPQAQFSSFNLPCNPTRPFPEHTPHFPNCWSLERGGVRAGRLGSSLHRSTPGPARPRHSCCTPLLFPTLRRPQGALAEQASPSGLRSPGLRRS